MFLTGCSLNQVAVNAIGDALANGGAVYAMDADPQLIREALPFGMKIFDSLLEVSPQHPGLLLAASRAFAAYAYLLQDESERDDKAAPDQRRSRNLRIRNLFLRGWDYALRGLATRHRGFANQLSTDPATALALMSNDDVPFLYWAGASLGGAITAAKGDLDLLARLPIAGALMQRVVELEEAYDFGAAHEFMIAYEAVRPNGSIERARLHYRRALELSQGRRASVHLALAEAVAVKEQNLAEFRALIAAATLAASDATPEFRLINAIARQRAAWLHNHIDNLFIDAAASKETAG